MRIEIRWPRIVPDFPHTLHLDRLGKVKKTYTIYLLLCGPVAMATKCKDLKKYFHAYLRTYI